MTGKGDGTRRKVTVRGNTHIVPGESKYAATRLEGKRGTVGRRGGP